MSHPKSVFIDRFGPPEVMGIYDRPMAELPADEIKIRVKAAGVNFADIMMRQGLYPESPKPPFVPGYEVAGEILEVGAGVPIYQVGQRVMAVTKFGGYSEVVHVRPVYVRPIPETLDFVGAAAMPVNYLTAWLGLYAMARMRKGDVVFVHHVMGGVGMAAAQMVRMAGGRVLGTTGSTEKIRRAHEMGFAEVFSYEGIDFEKEVRQRTQGAGCDIILDAKGMHTIEKDFKALKSTGRVIVFGAADLVHGGKRNLLKVGLQLLTAPKINPIRLMSQNRGIYGLNVLKLFNHVDLLQEGIAFIEEATRAGHLKPVIAATFPFLEVAQAHAYLQDRRNIGKVVLTF